MVAEMRDAGLPAWVDPAGNVFGGLGARSFEADHPAVIPSLGGRGHRVDEASEPAKRRP